MKKKHVVEILGIVTLVMAEQDIETDKALIVVMKTLEAFDVPINKGIKDVGKALEGVINK